MSTLGQGQNGSEADCRLTADMWVSLTRMRVLKGQGPYSPHIGISSPLKGRGHTFLILEFLVPGTDTGTY